MGIKIRVPFYKNFQTVSSDGIGFGWLDMRVGGGWEIKGESCMKSSPLKTLKKRNLLKRWTYTPLSMRAMRAASFFASSMAFPRALKFLITFSGTISSLYV